MKKKALSFLLAICMTAAMVTACGSTQETAPQETEAVEETEPEEEAPVEPTYETVSYEVSITEVDEEAGTYKAYDANGQEYILTAADTLSEDEKALLTAGANLKVSTEVEVAPEDQAEKEDQAEAEEAPAEESEAAETETAESEDAEEASADESDGQVEEVPEEQAPIEITVTAVEALGETEGYELNQAVQQATLGYTMEDMADTQMFAKSSVNVRKGPSADDEKLGSLSTAQEVTVTGLTSSNWYRISYNDGTAYVSAEYLQNEKPVVQTAKKSSGGSSGGASSGGSAAAGPTEADLYTVYSEAEMDAAYASGDMALFNQMITANTDAYDAKWGTTWGSASAQAPTTSGGGSSSGGSSDGSSSTEKSTSTSRELADYINQKRAEDGRSEIAWSDSLASVAAERAEEIVDDFSHNGARNCNSEIIQKTGSSSVASWYDTFYNSAGHRAAMINSHNKTVGAAVCHSGSYYYVVVLFDI